TCEMEVQLKNVRVYEGKALDVISYKQTDGKASAVVDFLNDENPVFGCTVTETERVLVEEDFSKSVDFTDGQRFSRVTSLDDADYVVEIVDGAMHYRKALNGNKSLEQRILIPKYENTASANDIVFEYDLMLPDKTTWTQTVDTAFMYFDIYIKHPVKPLRQTMYIQNDRLKVGSMVFAFRDICKTSDYDGKWMSFRHRYYFENEEWKCDFSYRQREESEWKTVKNAPMNASTNSNNFIRFYAYPEDQVEICVDNIKVINTGKDVHSGQLVMGLYHNGYMAGIGYTESFTDTVQPYGTRRFVLEDVGYAENNDIIPDAKFFVWNNLDEKIPLTDAVEVKSNLFNKEQE
ncbi:MAG: hypothetical protein IKV88_05320, partial [Clostridia bacterium]|nr:hypothetical protein [Clostridia bacterium]